MDFIGKICPYCKSEFKENEDIVICSICEMPHHKECWNENKACTTFGCTGTIMGTEESEYMHEIFSNNYSLYNEISTDEDMRAFIGKNQTYFLERFKKFNITNSKVSWNWASTFFGAYWYAYRKMYKIQFLYYVLHFLNLMFLGILLSNLILSEDSILILLIFIIPFVLSGAFGNYLYNRHAEKHIKIAKNMHEYIKPNYLEEKGGTSKRAVWAIIAIMIFFKII